MKGLVIKSFAMVLLIIVKAQDNSLAEKNFVIAKTQLTGMLKFIGDTCKSPGYTNEKGELKLVAADNWVSGFFPGCLWYMYEYTKNNRWKKAAEFFTNNEKSQQYNGTTHDIGFKINCSYGNGYSLTKNEQYKKIIIQSAKTLSTRFNPKIGCIRSWDFNKNIWEYPVIIDKMMNLELLFNATGLSGDSSFYGIAVTHANTTLKNQFRTNYSTWHVVNYDTLTGNVISKFTHQGYSNGSCWARGESWALYGFTMCYRYTKNTAYLNVAEHIANYILTNKNLPKDLIPYWDYNAPDIPDAKKDASAAAIMCSALYELSLYSLTNGREYKKAADIILKNLSSPLYLSQLGKNNNFLLMHSVGNMPANSQLDVPEIYADYYFLESNLRKMKIEK